MSRFASILTFSGAVQGVGFRRRTVRIAAEHPVCGYVKNLADGNVELYVEGDEEQCQNFVDHVKREMCREIVSFEAKTTPAIGLISFFIER